MEQKDYIYEQPFTLHVTPKHYDMDTEALNELFHNHRPLSPNPYQAKTPMEQKVTDATWEWDGGARVVARYEAREPLTETEQMQAALLTTFEIEVTDCDGLGKDLFELTHGQVYARAVSSTELHVVTDLDTTKGVPVLTDDDLRPLSEEAALQQ